MPYPCLLCSGETYNYTCTTKPQWSYRVCPSCGFTSLADKYSLNPEQEKQRYLLHQNNKLDTNYRAWLEIFMAALMQYVRPGSSVLDFGSGPNPVLAELLAHAGFQVTLFDPYFAPNKAALEKQYHAIVIHEVIEHLANPLATLYKLIPLLEESGIFAIRTQIRPVSDEAFDRFWYRKDQTHRSFFMEKTCSLLGEQLELSISWHHNDIFFLKKQ